MVRVEIASNEISAHESVVFIEVLGCHAYPETAPTVTQDFDAEIGVTTSDDNGVW